MPSIALINLGCSKNIVDGEKILHRFCEAGYTVAENSSVAEAILVNTCAFIREAQEEAIASILDAASFKKEGKCQQLIVCGCFSERYRKEVADQFPEVDHWISSQKWEAEIEKLLKRPSATPLLRQFQSSVVTQYLKIAEGCSHRCAFCVIPSIRGNFKSRPQDELIQEAQILYEQGTRELILVAQDTSYYGRDAGSTLVALLESLLKKTNFHWIRMMYLHPQYVTDELLDLVAAEKRVCSYFDIPLQHIAEPILHAMKRQPLTQGIYDLVDRIRSKIPDASLRSSFILGFPGETAAHFKELQQFIEYARFDKLGVFPFSPEEGTAAYDLKPRPKTATAVKRCETLMLQQREISAANLENKIGQKIEIIVDDVSSDTDFNFEARSQYDAPEVDGKVLIMNGDFTPGKFYDVRIVGAGDYDCYAEPA
ncbi:MAG TPA: 30S ribosomal protein S12 methylthiotransferase RimO [Chitinispirillaceae bacterium]|nr:30S ribosomal protein S12 methylthiotransferase RimO [Chitinispirillaceae bacterium]